MAIHSQYVTGRKIVYLYIFIVYKDLNLLSVYNLCSSIPFEEITAALSSAYVMSVLVVELVTSPPDAVTFLATVLNPALTPTLASTYGLSTAVT